MNWFRFRDYGLSVASSFLAALITLFLFWNSEEPPLIWLLGAVMVSAWFGGMGPGILSAVLSAILAIFIYSIPQSLDQVPLTEWIRYVSFIILSILICWLNHIRRRSEAEAVLLKTLLVDKVPVFAIFMVNPRGIIVSWNKGGQNIFGFSTPEAIGQSGDILFTPEDVEHNVPELEMQHAIQNNWSDDNRWHKRRDGSLVYVRGAMIAVRDERGKIVGFTKIVSDETRRKEFELQLARNENSLRLALEAAEAGTWTWDVEKNQIVRGPWMNRLLGLDAVETYLPSEEFYAPIHPDDRPMAETRMKDCLSRGESYHATMRILRSDGSIRWIQDHGRPILDPDGKIMCMTGVSIDITGYKNTEEALRRSEMEYRTTFESAGIAKTQIDPITGRFIRVNPKMCELTGYTKEELLQRTYQDITHPDDREDSDQVQRRAITAGKNEYSLQKRYIRKNGEFVHVEVTSSIIRSPEGIPLRILGVIQDITQRVRAESALRDNEEWLRLATEAGNIGTWEFNNITGRLRWSDRCKALFGVPKETEISYEFALSRMHPEDRERVDQAVRDAFAATTGGDFTVEYRIFRDGKIRWHLSKGRPQFEGEGVHRHVSRLVGMVFDITERKELQAELERRVQERTSALQEKNEQLETFSYTVAHDLRAPLRAMQGLGTVLKEDYSQSIPQEGKVLLDRIITASEKMDHLVNDLLKYTRASTAEIEQEPINLEEVLQNVLIDLGEEINRRNATIEIRHPLPAAIGSHEGIYHVFYHLIYNAISFARPDVPPKVKITSSAYDNRMRVEIQDNGIGIAPEHQERIFRMFEKLHAQDSGTGSGLAIVRRSVERMGGSVGVHSTPGEGSTFWFDLQMPAGNAMHLKHSVPEEMFF